MIKLEYYRVIAILLFCILTIIFAGCRRLPPPPEGLPDLYSCKVTVTFGGEIIDGVNVSLSSVDSNYKWSAGGRTDKNGVAKIQTSFAFPGAPKGQFKIGFDKFRSEDDAAGNRIQVSYIPLKYSRYNTTEIIEIKEGKNEFSFDYDSGEEIVKEK
jgi:hypothetical protein